MRIRIPMLLVMGFVLGGAAAADRLKAPGAVTLRHVIRRDGNRQATPQTIGTRLPIRGTAIPCLMAKGTNTPS